MNLGSLLSGSRSYAIPIFQRSYSWTSDEVGQLLADLWEGIAESRQRQESYCGLYLGSLVVVDAGSGSGQGKTTLAPEAFQVIDGKQRLTTLTILLAALRDRLGPEAPWINDLLSHVNDEGRETIRAARLTLGLDEDSYFGVQVRRPGATRSPVEPENGSVGGRCIRQCQQTILDDFEDRTAEELAELAEFLRDRVAIALISAPDIDTGFRLFLTTTHRGKPLTSADILKVELISGLPESDREPGLERWRRTEKQLGEEFGLLPGYLRVLHGAGHGATIREVLELSQRLGGAKRFLDEFLFPVADILHPILKAGYSGFPQAEPINRSLRILGWLNARDWVTPALAFASRYPDRPDEFATFLGALDRLAYGMLIVGIGGDRRLARYRDLVEAISGGMAFDGVLGLMELNGDEQAKLLLNAGSNFYQRSAAACKCLLKRLSASYPGDVAVETLKGVTIEHVLPTNPSGKSPWLVAIPESADRTDCNKLLGNLVLVSKQQNDEAKNQGLDAKLRVFFPGGQLSPHAITNQLMGARSWTANDIRARDAALKRRIREIWGIPDKVVPSRKRLGKLA